MVYSGRVSLMMRVSMFSTTAAFFRFLIVDVLLDVLRFPLWWYARGAVVGAAWWRAQLKNGSDALALIVLAKNLGRPMFGDYTREGRAISFGVRLVQLVVSFALYLLWVLVVTAAWCAWFFVLPALIYLVLWISSYARA